MQPKYLVTILVLLAFVVPASPAHAGGVVSICDEAHLQAALAGDGTVTFGCSGTITLSSTITIAAATTLDGSGQNVILDGNRVVGVFKVNAGVMFNMNMLTIVNGARYDSGGGISNFGGTVIVSNSTFSSNNAKNGGGISNSGGTVIVSNSTFSGNGSQRGGGIYNSGGTLTVSNSTFSSNIAEWDGGGIYTSNGMVTVGNGTFYGNSGWNTGGGIKSDGGTIALQNTIVANSLTGGNCSGVHHRRRREPEFRRCHLPRHQRRSKTRSLAE